MLGVVCVNWCIVAKPQTDRVSYSYKDYWKNEETRLEAFEMKGLRKILRVSLSAKKTNEWVLNKAGVKSELLDTVKARKLAHYGSHHELSLIHISDPRDS